MQQCGGLSRPDADALCDSYPAPAARGFVAWLPLMAAVEAAARAPRARGPIGSGGGAGAAALPEALVHKLRAVVERLIVAGEVT